MMRSQKILETCPRCGTPTALEVIAPGGATAIVRCVCRCEEHAQLERQARRKNAERRAILAASCWPQGQAKALGAQTFDADDGLDPGLMRAAREYANRHVTLRKIGRGLIVWGAAGTGKTYAACAIANALLANSVPVAYTTASDYVSACYSARHNSGTKYATTDFLVLDDLMACRRTEWAIDTLGALIDARYRARAPIVACADTSPQAMAAALGERIAGRLFERCEIVETGEVERRQKIIKQRGKEQ